uniref:Uncharacterized protein n=1 Tax=Anguilla anguilla TaxID=7936 RepID=A0A0E9P9X6_ANGAN
MAFNINTYPATSTLSVYSGHIVPNKGVCQASGTSLL